MATPQDRANEMLELWQFQRLVGIPAQDRLIPSPANDRDAFERDLNIIREVMERTR